MRRSILAVIGLGILAASSPAMARGLSAAGDLEHARATQGPAAPVSEQDAELLERWGCLSGTRSTFCRRLNHRRRYHVYRRSR